MKTASGWVQGYNAQAAVNESQMVIAAVVTQDANDVGQLIPIISAVEDNDVDRARPRRLLARGQRDHPRPLTV
jgi:hypothetical protein